MSKAKEILSQLQAYYHKIENEQFSPNDLEEMVNLSRELYERSVILRYKSFEQKVFDKKNIVETFEAIEEKQEDKKEETTQEFDFSIFEEEETIVEKVVIEEPEVTQIEETPAFDFGESTEEEVRKEEPELEVISEGVETSAAEVVEEEIPQESLKMAQNGSGKWLGFFDKVAQEKHSGFISSINALSGSFGFNERLLYINELFNSDSDQFSEGIKKLDACADWNACMTEMDSMAENMSWDKDDEIVADFVGHVYRKYA